MEKRLGGNAADVQARAAQLGIFFNDCGFEAVLTRPNGRRVTTGTAPDHDHVVCHLFFSVAAWASGLATLVSE
jgi:hypothetical protein